MIQYFSGKLVLTGYQNFSEELAECSSSIRLDRGRLTSDSNNPLCQNTRMPRQDLGNALSSAVNRILKISQLKLVLLNLFRFA